MDRMLQFWWVEVHFQNTVLLFLCKKHLAETDFQFPGVHTNIADPVFMLDCPMAASQSGAALPGSMIFRSSKGVKNWLSGLKKDGGLMPQLCAKGSN